MCVTQERCLRQMQREKRSEEAERKYFRYSKVRCREIKPAPQQAKQLVIT